MDDTSKRGSAVLVSSLSLLLILLGHNEARKHPRKMRTDCAVTRMNSDVSSHEADCGRNDRRL